MTQATTTNTNTPRRAHPAAVRAAPRLRNTLVDVFLTSRQRIAALSILLSCLLPALQAHADTIARAPEPKLFPVSEMGTEPNCFLARTIGAVHE